MEFEESPIIKKDDSITPIVQKEKIDYNKILKNLNNVERKNYLHLIKENKNISEYTIQKYYGNFFHDYIHYISIKGSKDVQNVVALGIDKKFHISNSYLEGYVPFKTDKLWVPLQTIARKKTYQLDNLQYKGYNEIWQTSSQAFKFPRGDCEDHAIALADWLIEMGADARVAIGKYKKNGHAWVVLFRDNKEYILEATQKSNLRSPYRLAKYQTNYKPKMMFNREYFWFNKGTVNTTNYSSSKWLKKSIYMRIASNKI